MKSFITAAMVGLATTAAFGSDVDLSMLPPASTKKDLTSPKPLTPEQVGLIRAWIDQGAK